MDTTLATVTIISLLLAWAMAIVTWQRIRAERRRSDARLADMQAEFAEEPSPEVGAMAPTEHGWEPATRGPAGLFARAGARRGFGTRFREPAAMRDAASLRSRREPLAARPRFDSPDRAWTGGDGAPHDTRHSVERALPRAGEAEFHRGLATCAWSCLRRAALAPIPPAPTHWGHQAAAVALGTVLVAGVSLAERTPLPRGESDLPVELLSLEHRRQGNYLAVSGALRNPPGGRERSRVSISATVFDRAGEIIGTGQTPLPTATLPPGRETAFTISLPNASRINRYRVSFMEDRSRLPHVDRRGPDAETPAPPGPRP